MPKVTLLVKVEAEVSEISESLVKVLGRDIKAGINQGTNENLNVSDLDVTSLDAEVSFKVNCMPEEEMEELGQ